MGRKGESICSMCKVCTGCMDYMENKKLSEEGFSIAIIECENFKR